MAVTTTTCQLKKRPFSVCGADSIGLCQYCARRFCNKHGEVLDDGQEICTRRFCIAKRNDLVRHLAYRADVLGRNEQRLCGIDACGNALTAQCVRCKGYYCGRHVGPREELVLENQVRVRRSASLCQHCWARRPIWLRT
jgi:hypothetical protein